MLKKTLALYFRKLVWNRRSDIFIIVMLVMLSALALVLPIIHGPLVYGDVSLAKSSHNTVNFIYSWITDSLGTSSRLSPGSFKDQFISAISPNSYWNYFLGYLLPILLLPSTYYLILRKLKLSKSVAILGAYFSLANPVVFGDFLNGQTFWIYITLPWLLYFTIKFSFYRTYTIENSIAISLFLFFCYGALPPIIIPLFLIEIMTVLACLLVKNDYALYKFSWSKFIFYGVLIFLIFCLLIGPYALIAPAGQQAYSPASLIADYYNNYSKTIFANIFRLAGNQGNGQGALGYNSPSFTNVFGYIFIALPLMALIMRKSFEEKRLLIIVLLVPTFVGLGLMHLMSSNVEFGLAVFKSQWITATIRNPTKIFVLLLPYVILAFCFSYASITNTFTSSRKIVFGVCTCFILTIYSYPVLSGSLGLFSHSTITGHQKDEDTIKAANVAGSTSRAILLPATHQDELNYQNISESLNTLRLGGQLPHTADLLQEINTSFNDKNYNFFKYLSLAGINEVFAKNAAQSYGSSSTFSLFPVGLDRSTTFEFLKSNFLSKSHESFVKFSSNRQSQSMIYSPRKLANIKANRELNTDVSLYSSGDAFINNLKVAQQKYADNYETTNTLASQKSKTSLHGKAALSNISSVLIDYYLDKNQDSSYLIIQRIDPVSRLPADSIKYKVADNDNYAQIGDKQLLLSTSRQRATLMSGISTLKTGELITQNDSKIDSSLANLSKVEDASKGRRGKPIVHGGHSTDRTEGAYSNVISTRSHLAYFSKPLALQSQAAGYLVQVDYKNIEGSGPSIDLVRNQEEVVYSSGVLNSDKSWKTVSFFLSRDKLKANSTPFLDIYTDTTDKGKRSENLIDNLRISKIAYHTSFTANIPSYESDYQLEDYTNFPDEPEDSRNLLKNGSFEDKTLWGKVEDASISAAGKPKISALQHKEGLVGSKSLELKSSNHTAYVAQTINNIDPDKTYNLSFAYKNVAGQEPSFALLDNNGNQISGSSITKQSNWSYYNESFSAKPGTTSLTIYLYSQSLGSETINLFDDVKLSYKPIVTKYYIKQSMARVSSHIKVDNYKELNPTLYSAEIEPKPGLIIFNQSYSKGWRAFIARDDKNQSLLDKFFFREPGEEISQASHYEVNGFANAWFIENSERADGTRNKLIIEYWPQRIVYVGISITLLTLLTLLVILSISFLKQLNYEGNNKYKLNRSADQKSFLAKLYIWISRS